MNTNTQRISLEIDGRTLRRLLIQQQLNVREFHCLDKDGKSNLQRMLLGITATRL